MSKKIPKALRRAIVNQLIRSKGDGPLTTGQLAERVNADPGLPQAQKKNPRQLAFVLKRMAAEADSGVSVVVLSKNGISHHGTSRERVGYTTTLDSADEDPDLVEPPKSKSLTVILPPDCVEFLAEYKQLGLSPGRVFEQFIRADMEANGWPHEYNEDGVRRTKPIQVQRKCADCGRNTELAICEWCGASC